MATEVFSREDIALLNGEDVEIRPLPLLKLRKFMKIWSECITKVQARYKEAEEDETIVFAMMQNEIQEWQYDAWVPMCALALEEQLKGDRSDKQFKDYLEGCLDEATIYRILAVAGNLKLGPDTPNPVTAETTE